LEAGGETIPRASAAPGDPSTGDPSTGDPTPYQSQQELLAEAQEDISDNLSEYYALGPTLPDGVIAFGGSIRQAGEGAMVKKRKNVWFEYDTKVSRLPSCNILTITTILTILTIRHEG
jgi:hypothetical protein